MDRFTRRIVLLLLPFFLASILGCQLPEQPETATAAQVPTDELQTTWDAALAVLRKHDFQPDRQDRAQGVITTLPTTSMQWGELWRQDVADGYSFAEASLHAIQRKATIRFVRDADARDWTVQVQVDVYRLNVAESQVTSASSAYHAFSGALPTTEGAGHLRGEERLQWTHLGRDPTLEARLLNRILASAAA
jgi:hypothetical protein